MKLNEKPILGDWNEDGERTDANGDVFISIIVCEDGCRIAYVPAYGRGIMWAPGGVMCPNYVYRGIRAAMEAADELWASLP
jgi:hypothetical protein